MDSAFQFDGLANDEDSSVDAAIIGQQGCAKIKELVQRNARLVAAKAALKEHGRECKDCKPQKLCTRGYLLQHEYEEAEGKEQ